MEMKNDKLFEAQNEFEEVQGKIVKLGKENEKGLERKMTLLNK